MSEGNHPVHEIISFIRETDQRGLCFGRWPDSVLAIYLQWHHQNGSLVIVEEEGDVVALAVGTQMSEADIDKHWVPWNEEGDSLYVSDLLAETRQGMAACVDELNQRVREWKELKLFALRHGKKRQFRHKVFEKLWSGA